MYPSHFSDLDVRLIAALHSVAISNKIFLNAYKTQTKLVWEVKIFSRIFQGLNMRQKKFGIFLLTFRPFFKQPSFIQVNSK